MAPARPADGHGTAPTVSLGAGDIKNKAKNFKEAIGCMGEIFFAHAVIQ